MKTLLQAFFSADTAAFEAILKLMSCPEEWDFREKLLLYQVHFGSSKKLHPVTCSLQFSNALHTLKAQAAQAAENGSLDRQHAHDLQSLAEDANEASKCRQYAAEL